MIPHPGGVAVQRRRINRRINRCTLKQLVIRDTNCELYWHFYKKWTLVNRNTCINVSARFVLSPGYYGRDLYRIELDFQDNGTIPRWFPRYDELNPDIADFLHISLCFTTDIENMDLLDNLFACLIIADIKEDPNWSGEQIHNTYIKWCPDDGGTFYLAGFDTDVRLQWLHEHGHYHNRSFAHIALYPGGIHR